MEFHVTGEVETLLLHCLLLQFQIGLAFLCSYSQLSVCCHAIEYHSDTSTWPVRNPVSIVGDIVCQFMLNMGNTIMKNESYGHWSYYFCLLYLTTIVYVNWLCWASLRCIFNMAIGAVSSPSTLCTHPQGMLPFTTNCPVMPSQTV